MVTDRSRRPLAAVLTGMLLLSGALGMPAVADAASANDGRAQAGGPASEAAGGPGSQPQESSLTLTATATEARPGTATHAPGSFQTDLFSGAATAEIPIVVPPGTAGVAPVIALHYHSLTVDELGPRDQGQWTGLGFTLDAGGFVVRDTRGTTETTDDAFKLTFQGATYGLVLTDAATQTYHTKEETFWRVRYDASGDAWTVTTKDGTRYLFGDGAGTRAIMRLTTGAALTYKYMLSKVVTTSGAEIRYTYTKQTAPVGGTSYDQAIYPDRITYTYHGGAPVGQVREVRFVPGDRADWANTGDSSTQAFFEQRRLDAIEIRVGPDLVRRYAFAYDYSVDRDPAYTWGDGATSGGGGATGDLTLRSLTQYGTDGASALPPLAFDYAGARLGTVHNGIGGTVSYAYERVATVPLYSACLAATADGLACAEWGVRTAPDAFGWSTALGHALAESLSGTLPLYSACLSDDPGTAGCDEWGVSTTPDAWGFSTLAGYVSTTSPVGTRPLYASCLWLTPDGTSCEEWGGTTAQDAFGTSTLLGYVYAGKLDRRRVGGRQTDDGRGGTATTSFTYTDLGMANVSAPGEPEEWEFRGHGAVRTYDPVGHFTDSWFHQDDGKKGRTYEIEARDGAGVLYTRTVNTWTATAPHPGVTFVSLARADVHTCDGDATCKQASDLFQYDSYGNVTRAQHLGDVGETGDERTDVTDFVPNAAAHIVSLPARTAVVDATGATVAETWLFYDGAAAYNTPPTVGNLTRRCDRLDGAPSDPCVSMAYDVYGNVTQATDARGNTTTTTYDASGTFPASVTTPPTQNVPGGLVTTRIHDPRFGVVTTETNPDGRTATYGYDAFGRLVSITDPLGETTTVSFDQIGIVGVQRVTTRLPDGSPDGLWTEEYFDGFGRTFKVRREGAAGRVVVRETDFDDRGLVARQGLPRFEGAVPVWTTYAYDVLSRETTVTLPDGTTETTAYDDWATVVTDRKGRTRRSVMDAYGRVRQITEPGGTAATSYVYDTLGRLTRVTDAAGNVTSITYDTLGRKTAMTEPNMGTWSYAYDAAGNLTSQTDAKGRTLTFEYDALGRLTRKVYPVDPGTGTSPTITFTYDTAADGKGRLATMTDLAGSVSYEYDALGRRTAVTRLTDGVPYVTRTTYTSLGKPATITYPDGEVVTYGYDGGGGVRSASGAGAYATGIDYDAAGQVVRLEYGNGVVATWTYDPLTGRVVRQRSGPARVDATALVPLERWVRSWEEAPAGYAAVYAGAFCVEYTTGGCVGGDLKAEPGHGPAVGFVRTSPDAGTVPVYRAHCYADAAGACTGWGLSLVPSGAAVGYLPAAAPDPQSAGSPLADSTGLLLRGLAGGRADAYLYTSQTVPAAPRTEHLYTSDGSIPAGYAAEGTTAYLLQSAGTGTVALVRYVNAATGHHYYSTAGDPPAGFASELTLGHLHTQGGPGRPALYRHHDAATGDYLVDTSAAPPAGYQLEATLGYAVAMLQDVAYTYDAVGNVTSITDHRAPGNSRSFAYDDLDRLTGAAGAFGTESYAYDAIGNMLSRAGVTYAYGAAAQTCGRTMPHAVTSTSDGKAYSYDCNGNMLSDGERTFAWDADDRPSAVTLAGVGTTMFAYGGDGARVRKVSPTRTVRYIGAFEAHVTDGVGVKHVVVGSLRVATRVTGGANSGVYFALADHLGSLEVLTNEAGIEVQRLGYRPYGETYANTGSVDFDQRRYTGQELDPETGLYFYQARYYNPALGRFVSADTVVPGPGNPQNLNRYSYASNNPVNFTDPTGHFSLKREVKRAWRRLKNWVRKHEEIATVIGVATQGISPAFGTAVLTQTEVGRYVVAGEIIVASAVVTWACGGCAAGVGATLGSAVGAGTGGYAAHRVGGDISKGVLFGAATGAVAGAAGGYLNGALQAAVADTGAVLKALGYLAGGITEGGLLGGGSGATAGYAGGAGGWGDILLGAGIGALYGAAGGTVLGAGEFALQQWTSLQLTAAEWLAKVRAATGPGAAHLSRGAAIGLTARMLLTEMTDFVLYPALQAGVAWELLDPFVEDSWRMLLDSGVKLKVRCSSVEQRVNCRF